MADIMETPSEKQGLDTMSSSIEHADNYVRWMIQYFKTYFGPTLLEVGTGHGNFRGFFPPLEEFASIDIDPQVVKAASERDPAGMYLTADVTANDFKDLIQGRSFSAVICINVLEHLKNEKKAVENMVESLEPGGYMLLLAPALPGLFSDLDRLAGHYRRYTKKALRDLVPIETCKIIKLEYFNPLGGLGWWVNKFFRHRDLDADRVNFQIIFFDKYVLPVSRIINPLTKPFFGQSVILVGRKI